MKKKYVSFLGVMFMVLGGTIGAGIFFKNETILDNTGSILLAMLSWVIAIFAVFCISMTFSDIIKKSGWDNSLGYVGWIKKFCGTGLYKGFRNFMFWIFLPGMTFILPYYSIMSFQDALSIFTGSRCVIPWYAVMLISVVILIYFQYMAVINKNVSIKQNFILSYIKFLPILFAIFGGIFYFAYTGHPQNPVLNVASDNGAPFNLIKFSPAFGVIAAIPAIFFAFDGFYTASGVYSDMKEPKKFSSALCWGIALTAIIYVLISIGMLLGVKTGAITGWISVLSTTPGKVLLFIILFCISCSVIAILNAWTIYNGEFYRDVIRTDSNKFNNWVKSKVNINDKKQWALFLTLFQLITFCAFSIVGVFFYSGIRTNVYYDNVSRCIYAFCDLIADWCALLSFVGIGIVILFAVIQKINTSKKYMFYSITAISLTGIAALFEVVLASSNLISSIIFQVDNPSTNPESYLIPYICEFVVLLIFLGVCFTPMIKQKIAKRFNLR